MLNKYTNIIVFIVLAATHCAVAKGPKLSLEGQVQPMCEVEQNGSFTDHGENEFKLNRAKLGIQVKQDLKELTFSTKISLDFAEKKSENYLKNAWVKMKATDWLSVRVGQFKSQFGYESEISSKNIPLIYRGYLSDYIRNEISLGGYQQGFELSGNLPINFSYSAALFNYDGFQSKGGDFNAYLNRFFAMPVLKLFYKPSKMVVFNYALSFPYTGAVLETNELVGQRYVYHNWGTKLTFKHYAVLLDLFVGPDTSSSNDLRLYLEDFNECVTQGLNITQTGTVYPHRHFAIDFSGRFELLNGYSYNGDYYEDREFYGAFALGTRAVYRDNYRVELFYDNRFDRKFSALAESRIALQATILFDVDIDLKKEKK